MTPDLFKCHRQCAYHGSCLTPDGICDTRRLTMRLTREQEAERIHTLGASEVSAVLGVNPWRSAFDVWASKAVPGGRGPLIPSSTPSEQAELGHLMEPLILRLYCSRTGVEVRPCETTYRHPELSWLTATPDALVVGQRVLVEAKNVGARVMSHWDDGVPPYVTAQAQQQLIVVGGEIAERVDVAAVLGGAGLSIYAIHPDVELQALMLEQLQRFRRDYWERDVPPPRGPLENLDEYARKRFTRVRSGVEVSSDKELLRLLAERRRLKAIEKATAADLADIDGAIKSLVGEREGLTGDWGRVLWAERPGKVDWRVIAEELAGGPVEEVLVAQLRGLPYRQLDVRLSAEFDAIREGMRHGDEAENPER